MPIRHRAPVLDNFIQFQSRLAEVHPTSEKTPKVDACIVVRGIGMLPAEGSAGIHLVDRMWTQVTHALK